MEVDEANLAPAIRVFHCRAQVVNLVDEVVSSADASEWMRVTTMRRACSYFEPFRPVASFEEHVASRQRRTEVAWGVGGAVIGALVASAVPVLFELLR
ncbi:MAG: hypothetical protein EPO22_01950 [Dehalococcoidia bacterium]|nr:MAG: hypothetical protein EPO22_01950 [Dehalococcoidia bacterium]